MKRSHLLVGLKGRACGSRSVQFLLRRRLAFGLRLALFQAYLTAFHEPTQRSWQFSGRFPGGDQSIWETLLVAWARPTAAMAKKMMTKRSKQGNMRYETAEVRNPTEILKRLTQAPPPPTHVGRRKRDKGKLGGPNSKLPTVTPNSRCRLRLLRMERIKDYLLIEEEFIKNQERLRPEEIEEKTQSEQSQVHTLRLRIDRLFDAKPTIGG